MSVKNVSFLSFILLLAMNAHAQSWRCLEKSPEKFNRNHCYSLDLKNNQNNNDTCSFNIYKHPFLSRHVCDQSKKELWIKSLTCKKSKDVVYDKFHSSHLLELGEEHRYSLVTVIPSEYKNEDNFVQSSFHYIELNDYMGVNFQVELDCKKEL